MAHEAGDDPTAGLIHSLLAAFNAVHRDEEVDVEGIVGRLWHPEAELVPRYAAAAAGPFRGREGAVRFLEESRRQFRGFEVRFELDGLYGEGERRVAVYTVVAHTRDSRIDVRQTMGADLEARAGQLYRLVVHADPKDAFSAAGIDPAKARRH